MKWQQKLFQFSLKRIFLSEIRTTSSPLLVLGNRKFSSSIMASAKKTGDLTWGFLEDTEIYGRKAETSDYIRVSADSLNQEQQVKLKHEASHCLLYAKPTAKGLGVSHSRPTILMQARFDGYIGFPGGLIDAGEDAVFSLNRELKEEMHLDLTKFSVKPSDYVISHFNEKIGLRLYFYALEVSMDELKKIETNALLAKDYGSEVLGTIRVPLYTYSTDDGYRGFPVFLKHQFIGNAREQLLFTIKHLNLLTEEEINRAVHESGK